MKPQTQHNIRILRALAQIIGDEKIAKNLNIATNTLRMWAYHKHIPKQHHIHLAKMSEGYFRVGDFENYAD